MHKGKINSKWFNPFVPYLNITICAFLLYLKKYCGIAKWIKIYFGPVSFRSKKLYEIWGRMGQRKSNVILTHFVSMLLFISVFLLFCSECCLILGRIEISGNITKVKHSRTSAMELFWENRLQLKPVNYFRKKAPL